MKLKTIKSKGGNSEYNELISKTIELIKAEFEINLRYHNLFFLCWYNSAMVFLYQNTVVIAAVEYEIDIKSKPRYDTAYLSELYTIKLLKDYPKTKEDIEFKTVLNKSGVHWFKPEIFLNWIDEPSEITEVIDNPYYEVIRYLQHYNKNTFSDSKYLFYPKADGDSNFILNLYAYDKKTKTEVKIYIPDIWNDTEKAYIPPVRPQDIAIDGSISNYQKLQIKKAFIKLANEQNEYFNVKNFWALELLKLTIQPVDILHEWSCHRCFSGNSKFNNIWVYDCPKANEEPYFFITDSPWIQDTAKIAVLNFKNPTYHSKGIYKSGNVKRKGWVLDETYIKELMEFLNSPSDRTDSYNGYKKYVKTNWQQLIFEYNHNTAGWGWSETGFNIPPEKDTQRFSDIEALPFCISIPDYTQLLNDKEL